MTPPPIEIIGAGLAGCEAALQLAKRGYAVTLYDTKPHHRSPAHHAPTLAEIVCSNSLGALPVENASGLLKQEMSQLGCELLAIAKAMAVPAGKALAVDREKFSAAVTEKVAHTPNITFISQEVAEIDPAKGITLVATGPLTTDALGKTLATLVQQEQLYFFDAAAPILEKDSINLDVAFFQDRYNKSATEDQADPSDASYINCPLEKDHYFALLEKLLGAEKTPLKSFEADLQNGVKTTFFESCLPVEILAARGPQTLRYGPLKPVGLIDPRTGRPPYAVVQLRQDNAEGTLYNMVGFQNNLRWGPQKEMIQSIPGLEQAEIVRYGVMHRNTYLHSPTVLTPTLQLKAHPTVLIAGQLTGTEGYTESIATGLVAALSISRILQGQAPVLFPTQTMIGALLAYITRAEAIGKPFQPINSNWGILPPLEARIKSKPERNLAYVHRAEKAMASAVIQLQAG